MNNPSTADGRGQDAPHDAEPFFPSEGTFNPVVPFSEVGRAPLSPVNSADVGKPAEAHWAREAHRAGLKDEEETTLVPARRHSGHEARPSWVVTAAVITLSVMAGLASGAYLIWSSQRAPEAQRPPQVAAEAPPLPPAPPVEEVKAETNVERKNEAAEDDKAREVAKAEDSREVARPAPTPRAERAARADDEALKITPAPKPARTQSAPTPRTRVTTAERRPSAPAPSARALPVSTPPPSAKSSKVIQWP